MNKARTRIEFLEGDITKVKVDAIVNAANTTLLGGEGVDGAIHRAAGPGLLEECRMLKGCKTGKAKITKGYNLPARFIIHTVGPVWHGGGNNEDKLLESCYGDSLELAKSYSLKSIAFPSISTGAYRFPIDQATSIAVNTVKTYIDEHPGSFKKVIFVLFSNEDLQLYRAIQDKAFPRSI